jgi:sugar diacid utilization regulator/putative methionine-R-sulfoxide reductase with GAF domain
MTALPFPIPAVMDRDAVFLRRLLSANDTTQAVQIAVDHVVESLGCAVSWVGLVEGDYLRMGAHRGVRSAEMASAWQLKIGEGIGGRVASERKPHMSRDYRHDSRRVPLLKRLIDNEGIQATLIVPLLMADEALGVLYAAQRRPYPWSEGEQEELERIGQDLAIRLRQLDVDGRRECGSLAGSLADRDDMGSALELLALEVGGLVELRERTGRLVRAAGAVGDGNPRVVWRGEMGPAEGLVLSVIDVRELDEVAAATIELVAGLFRLQVLRLGERERTIERLNGEMLDQLLSGRIADTASFRQRLSTMGVSADEGQVIVIGSRRGDQDQLSRLADSLTGIFARCTTAMRAGRLVVLVDVTDEENIQEQLRALLSREWNRGTVAGVGRPCTGLGDYAMSYDQARAACELGMRRTDHAPVLTAHDLGIVPLASVPLDHLRSMVQDALGPLVDADEQRGTDLLETLRVYLGNDRHLPATASALHVHYNTVRNRIVRIEELLGVDVRDVEDRFQLETALRMHALTEALAGDDPLSRRDSGQRD